MYIYIYIYISTMLALVLVLVIIAIVMMIVIVSGFPCSGRARNKLYCFKGTISSCFQRYYFKGTNTSCGISRVSPPRASPSRAAHGDSCFDIIGY